jgi:hypothetical protein
MQLVTKRKATLALSVLLVLLLAQCKGSKPNKAGDKCPLNDVFTCVDPSNALLCVGGTLQAAPCRGPHGCQGVGASVACDHDLAMVGETCSVNPAHECRGLDPCVNLACSVDQNSELVCEHNQWAILSTCKGPRHCKVESNLVDLVKCDDDVADVGDPCETGKYRSNVAAGIGRRTAACTPDKKKRVVCTSNDPRSRIGTFALDDLCDGPKGCYVEDDRFLVFCDKLKNARP